VLNRDRRTRKQRQKKDRKKKWVKSVIAGVGSSILALGLFTGAVYASQVDSSESLSSWLSRQLEISRDNIEKAIMQETTRQKERLQVDLDQNKRQVVQDLNIYTDAEIKVHIKAVQDYADSLSKTVSKSHGKAKSTVQEKLNIILLNSIVQMKAVLSEGAVPLTPLSETDVPLHIGTSPTLPPSVPSTGESPQPAVNDSVYGKNT
jgi:dsDNA-binding SOS-regulon protein